MKMFLAGVLALALEQGAALFYEWSLHRATMARLQQGHLVPAAHDSTVRAATRSE